MKRIKRTGLYVLSEPLHIICLGLLTLDMESLFHLFCPLLKSKQGDIAAQTISNWIKDKIHFTLEAHDVKAQEASWSFRGGVPYIFMNKKNFCKLDTQVGNFKTVRLFNTWVLRYSHSHLDH